MRSDVPTASSTAQPEGGRCGAVIAFFMNDARGCEVMGSVQEGLGRGLVDPAPAPAPERRAGNRRRCVLGAAMACFEEARQYASQRIQFGKPIASFQLVQRKLALMLTELTKAQLLAWRLANLKEAGQATFSQISMAKRNNVHTALEIARTTRDILGGVGILDQHQCFRHMANLESVKTYEGTEDMHLLILGEQITGISAFA